MKTFREWQLKTNESADYSDLFDVVTKESAKQQIMQMLGEHPELVDGIKNFKQNEPEKFKKSIDNFNNNNVELNLLIKLSKGKFLGYYDWM